MILAVPVDTPVTDPEAFTVATKVALLDHEAPPGVASDKMVTPPVHTVVFPVIATGAVLTLIEVVVKQPVPRVYVIVAGPAEMPVTFPDPSSEILVLVVLQIPPATKSLREVVSPAHTVGAPPMPDGTIFTVTCAVAIQPIPVA